MAWRGGRDNPGLLLQTSPNYGSQDTDGLPAGACPVRSKASVSEMHRCGGEGDRKTRLLIGQALHQHLRSTSLSHLWLLTKARLRPPSHPRPTPFGAPKSCITFSLCCDPVTVGTRAPLTCTATDGKGRGEMESQRGWEGMSGTNRPQGGPENAALSLSGVNVASLWGGVQGA